MSSKLALYKMPLIYVWIIAVSGLSLIIEWRYDIVNHLLSYCTTERANISLSFCGPLFFLLLLSASLDHCYLSSPLVMAISCNGSFRNLFFRSLMNANLFVSIIQWNLMELQWIGSCWICWFASLFLIGYKAYLLLVSKWISF